MSVIPGFCVCLIQAVVAYMDGDFGFYIIDDKKAKGEID